MTSNNYEQKGVVCCKFKTKELGGTGNANYDTLKCPNQLL